MWNTTRSFADPQRLTRNAPEPPLRLPLAVRLSTRQAVSTDRVWIDAAIHVDSILAEARLASAQGKNDQLEFRK
jgi:hypothetical protein